MSLRIDGQANTCGVVATLLRREGYLADSVGSGAEALERLRATACDVLVTDLVMPGMDGRELVENATTVIGSIVRAKPSAAKGKYIKSLTLSSTMGPGVPLDSAVADAAGKH